jgi:hypothetical protein
MPALASPLPRLERLPLLCLVRMPIVHGGDARFDVIENLADDETRHAVGGPSILGE